MQKNPLEEKRQGILILDLFLCLWRKKVLLSLWFNFFLKKGVAKTNTISYYKTNDIS